MGRHIGGRGPFRASAQLKLRREHLLFVVVRPQCQGQSTRSRSIVVRRDQGARLQRRAKGHLQGRPLYAADLENVTGPGRRRVQNQERQSAGGVQLQSARQCGRTIQCERAASALGVRARAKSLSL